MAAIALRGLRKAYGGLEVIHGVDLDVADGSFTVLVGPSGCGKSTMLRMIAGLEDVTAGEVRIGGQRVEHLMPGARGLAMVFQNYALYPHMTVAQNLRFGLENQRLPRAEIARRVARAADILRLAPLLDRRPSQLSGGQGQRVAIGRAIVKEPRAFLLDEPLSNLDAELRAAMRTEIAGLHRRLGATMVYVTHDQVEAMTMADTIVVLNAGRVEQAGAPLDLYLRPANLFVARFLGAPPMTVLSGRLVRRDGEAAVEAGGALVPLGCRDVPLPDGTPVSLGVRPEHLEPGEGPWEAQVAEVEVLGASTVVHARLRDGSPIALARPGILGARPGDRLRLGARPESLHLFDERGAALPPPDPAGAVAAPWAQARAAG